jgi:hypothetical protein
VPPPLTVPSRSRPLKDSMKALSIAARPG